MIANTTIGNGAFRADVLAGLRRPQKRIPAKYFYDLAGSQLFEQITELDEYYLTRTEMGIFDRFSKEMAVLCGPRCLLIELGAGNLVKARTILRHLERPAGFVPVDVSGEHLQAATQELSREYPELDVMPVCADFLGAFPLPSVPAARRVVFFPGSTLGNFDPEEAEALLRRVARLVGPGGGMLLGVDLRKDPKVIAAAYNDSLGVTAAFNLNLLHRMNNELGADFDADAFEHRAFYNRDESRIEMHLVSLVDQRVRLGTATIPFHAGETIHTENSYKFDATELSRLAARCGLRTDAVWTDEKKFFATLYLTATLR